MPLADRCEHGGPTDMNVLVNQTVVVRGQDRALPIAVPRSRGRLPAPIREPEDRQVRLRARLRERVGARHLREAAHQVRRMSHTVDSFR